MENYNNYLKQINLFLIDLKNNTNNNTMIKIYGSTDNKNIHTDTSTTLLGAKQYATRNGFKNVSLRVGYKIKLLEYKQGGKWYKYEDFLSLFK